MRSNTIPTATEHRTRRAAWWTRAAATGGAAILLLGLAACGEQDADRDQEQGQNPTPTATVRATSTRSTTATAEAATTPTRTPTPRPVRTPTALPTPAPVIGDTVELEDWQITVTGIDSYGRIGNYTAQGTYTYVRMTVMNTGDQPALFPYDGLVIVDMEDQSYFADLNATRETLTYDLGTSIDREIAPGETLNTAAAFDVPDTVTGLILTTPSRVFAVQLIYREQPK